MTARLASNTALVAALSSPVVAVVLAATDHMIAGAITIVAGVALCVVGAVIDR